MRERSDENCDGIVPTRLGVGLLKFRRKVGARVKTKIELIYVHNNNYDEENEKVYNSYNEDSDK